MIKILLMERIDIDTEERPHSMLTIALILRKQQYFLNSHYMAVSFSQDTHTHIHTQFTSLCLVLISRVSLFVIDQWNVNPGTALPNEKGV